MSIYDILWRLNMDYNEKENLSENKKIFLFKWFIKFLEIYGQETFGESASINWGMVHREIIGHDIWSMNMELDNLLYNSDEDLDSEKFTGNSKYHKL